MARWEFVNGRMNGRYTFLVDGDPVVSDDGDTFFKSELYDLKDTLLETLGIDDEVRHLEQDVHDADEERDAALDAIAEVLDWFDAQEPKLRWSAEAETLRAALDTKRRAA